jgi:hypothetical protein
MEVFYLMELEATERKLHESYEHNLNQTMCRYYVDLILEHCLNVVSKKRSLLTQEASLGNSIKDFLMLSHQKELRSGSSVNGIDILTSFNSKTQYVSHWTSRIRDDESINTDIIIENGRVRIELKTGALATSKDNVSTELFTKDLPYIQKKPYSSPQDHDFEGKLRKDRQADIVIYVADKEVAMKSKALRKLIPILGEESKIEISSDDGVTYIAIEGDYAKNQKLVLNQHNNKITSTQFICFAAFPSPREG